MALGAGERVGACVASGVGVGVARGTLVGAGGAVADGEEVAEAVAGEPAGAESDAVAAPVGLGFAAAVSRGEAVTDVAGKVGRGEGDGAATQAPAHSATARPNPM